MVYIGADHGGFELKEYIKKYFVKNKIDFIDCGNTVNDPNDNFPDFVRMVIDRVLKSHAAGILICGTGIGVSIAANRYRGIRAALCHSAEYAKLSRLHNDANVLCMGGRFIDKAAAIKITEMFLNTNPDPNPKYKKRMETADGVF
jgi:ribose 5-phosphate isomerase B